MSKEVVYVAELDADVDDVIAAEYLHRKGVLKEVVCDPIPKTVEGKERERALTEIGVTVSYEMPEVAKYIFVGGTLTNVAKYIVNHKVEYLVMNGGFVGCNIVKTPLDKFKGKTEIKTFNFNCNVKAADSVLRSKNIGNIVLVGKNVCHSEKNTQDGVWACERELIEKYHAKPTKRQHDMLACREGLIIIGLSSEESYLNYETLYPYNNGLNGRVTEWGSSRNPSQYRSVLAAVDWK